MNKIIENRKNNSHSELDSKSTKKAPKLRFKEFSTEWEENKLANVGFIVGGGTPDTAKHEYWNGNIQWFTPTEIKSKYIRESIRTISELGLKKSSAKLLPKGTLLLSSRATVGDVGIAINECSTNQGFQSLIVNKNNDNVFIYNWILKNKNEFIRKASGSTFLEISKKEVEKIKINLPTLEEQTKIADCLSIWDDSIENLKSLIENKKLYKKGMMQKLFSQEIRFKADDGSDFPDWEEKKLGEICDVKKGSQLNKDTLTKEGSYPALNGGINPSGYTDNWNTEANTITISEGGNSCGYVNFVNSRFWSGGHNYSLQKLKKIINVNYLYQYLKVNELDIMRLRVGSGLPNIQKGDIFNFKINLPTILEQTKIANFLSAIDEEISLLEQKLEQLQLQKKGLMQGMFV